MSHHKKIDLEIEKIVEDIKILTSDIKVFANGLAEEDMDIRYNQLMVFANKGQRLHVDRIKLESLKQKYGRSL